MTFEMDPRRTFQMVFTCEYKGVPTVVPIVFYATKKNDYVMAIPVEGTNPYLIQRKGPLGPEVFAMRDKIQAFWTDNARMPVGVGELANARQ